MQPFLPLMLPLDESLRPYCIQSIQGDILDSVPHCQGMSEYEIRPTSSSIPILSTKAEYNPETAHRVNVEGTLNLLRLAVEQAAWQVNPVKFIYPSSIAVYGIPTIDQRRLGKVKENDWLQPHRWSGVFNKLYCEHLGRYYTYHYRQLAADAPKNSPVDFRCLRFPGLISAAVIPT